MVSTFRHLFAFLAFILPHVFEVVVEIWQHCLRVEMKFFLLLKAQFYARQNVACFAMLCMLCHAIS